MSRSKRKKRKADRLAVVLMCVLMVLILLTIAGLSYFYTQISSTTIYPGITVCGVDVGGMTKQEALEAVKGSENGDKSFAVTAGDVTHTVSFSEANAYTDPEIAISEAYHYGRSGGMLERCAAMLRARIVGEEFSLSCVYDPNLVEQIIARLTSVTASEYRNSSYFVRDDVLYLDVGNIGRTIDVASLRAGLLENFQTGTAKDLTVATSLTYPDEIDFAELKRSIDKEPVNAYLNNEDLMKPFVVPEVNGVTLDLTALEKALEKEGSGDFGSLYTIPLIVHVPEITSDKVEFREPLADILASTETKLNSSNKPRTVNVQLACDLINGTVLLPGEEFSYNNVVGERTYERGFQDAKIYVSGEIVDGVGGGICQVSSTIYMAALRADLEITERRNHRFTVDYTPLGEDATVVYGQVDFKFKNTTEYPIRIDCVLEGNQVKVTLLGNQTTPDKEVKMETKILSKTPFETVTEYDSSLKPDETKVKNNGYTGYKTETYRVVYIGGEEISRTLENKSTYTKLNKVIRSGTDPNAPVTPPETTTPPSTTTTTPTDDEDHTQIPDWLRPQTDTTAPSTTVTPPSSSGGTTDIPDWLA